MKYFLFLSSLIISGFLCAQKSPACEELRKLPANYKVSGSSSFQWTPSVNENGVAFTGTINWYFRIDRTIGGKFQSTITGNAAQIDGESYSASYLGNNVFAKIRPTFSQWDQKAVLYYDIYQGSAFIKTIPVTSKNYMDWSSFSINNYFTDEEFCALMVKGFSIKISKVENMVFSGIDGGTEAKYVIKNLNSEKQKQKDKEAQARKDTENLKKENNNQNTTSNNVAKSTIDEDFWNGGGNKKSNNATATSSNTKRTNAASTNTSQQNTYATSVTNEQVAKQYRQQEEERQKYNEQQSRQEAQQRKDAEQNRKQEELRKTKQYVDQVERQTQSNVQAVNDALKSFEDILRQQNERASDEAEANRLRREEKFRLEKEQMAQEKREREEKERQQNAKQNLQNSFLQSIPDFIATNNRMDASIKDVYYFFIYRNGGNLYFSKPFIVRRYSDNTWPYKADIERKIKTISHGINPKLVGYFTSAEEAMPMLSTLYSDANNSAFTTEILDFVFKDYSSSKTETNEPSKSSSQKTDFWNQ